MMKQAAAMAMSLALLGGTFPAQAADLSPEGVWASTSGESHYQFSLCGNGSQLCAKLVYLRADALNDKTRPYLNTYLVENANPAGANRWQGEVHVLGQSAGGTFTLTGEKSMTLEGCYLVVFCKSYQLVKIE